MHSLSFRRGLIYALVVGAGMAAPVDAMAQERPQEVAAPGAKATTLDLTKIEAAADAQANWIIKRGAAPGVCIGVGKAGQLVFAKGYGEADIENGVAVTPDSVFRIGSITKQYTAAAIMRLVEQGKVKLDEPVRSFLPEFHENAKAVTVRQLLTHTSGLPNFTEQPAMRESLMSRVDVGYSDIAKVFEELPLDFEPGARHVYSNTGYAVLGEIIARVSGVAYSQYLQNEILRPLGLERTSHANLRDIVPGRVHGYVDEDGAFVHARFMNPDVAGAAGAVQSTVGDLVRWTHLLHTGKAVSSESFKVMTTPARLNDGGSAPYGFGLQLDPRLERVAIAHGGHGNGFSAYMTYYPAEDLTVVVLANGRGVAPDLAEEAVARAALGIEQEGPKLSTEDLARYEGTFTLTLNERTFDLRVYVEDGQLLGHRAGGRAFRFLPQGEHRFLHEQDRRSEFSFNLEDGKATSVTLKQPKGEVQGRRKP